jgi:hypothetical protein
MWVLRARVHADFSYSFNQMGRALRSLAAVVLALAVASTAAAHHSPSVFDLRKEATLTGVITAFQFRNPHLFFHLEVTDGIEFEGEWEVEAQSPRIMTLYGWSAKSLARGDRVTVVVNPPQQRGKRLALGRSVLKTDGTTLPIPWDRKEIRAAIRDQQRNRVPTR